MEEGQQMIKHVCKLCDKSFPCGRSLGGHMRSHVINSSPADQNDEKKLTKKNLSNPKNGLVERNEDDGYVLRENPKKTCRFADPNFEDSFLHEKFCKQCGKGFHSWKALFGHMKCHSEKFSNSLEADSWTSANQSETETAAAAAPNRKKRSRRVTRYISTTTTTNSSFSVANNNNTNNGSSSASEIDHQEQEEVALCLIMLSRDVVSKNSCFNSVDESSDNNFELLEAGSSIRSKRVTKNEGKNSWSSGGEAVKKFRKLRNGKLESTTLDSNSNSQFEMKQTEYGASGFSRNGSKESKLSKSDFQSHGFLGNNKLKKSKVEDGSRFEVCEVEPGKDLVKKNGWLDEAEFSSKKPVLDPKKLRNGKLNKSGFQNHGFLGNDKWKKSKVDDESRFEASEVELSKNLMKESGIEDQPEFSSQKHNLNPKKPRNGKLESTILESSSQFDSASEFSRNESTPNKSGFRGDGVLGNLKSKKPKLDDDIRFGPSELKLGKDPITEIGGLDRAEFSSKKHNLNKKRCRDSMNNPELGSESRSKFECTTCNKAFHSYQALGGHRASHKKTKGCCFSSKIDGSENSIETENISLIKNEELIEQQEAKNSCVVVSKNKDKKGAHECPICFRVFSSGQALGGHKRSHLIAEAKSSNQTVVIQKPIPEIRDLLDLNLPAPVEEESSGNVGFKPWWVGTNPKPEPLLGFLSN
ncbi:hypothetical protein C3L33_00895, partial [Rhododendron williamsianum]